MMHIHYRESDGEIFGWETTESPMPQHGLALLSDGGGAMPNPKTHKVDVATLTVVAKSSSEQAMANMPTLVEVQQAVVTQLAGTDQYMVPDRGLAPDVLSAWIAYRKALRDLSKGDPAVADMINNFPVSPDNFDAAGALRARLQQVTK